MVTIKMNTGQLELDLISFVLPQQKNYPRIFLIIRYISSLTDKQIIESNTVPLAFDIHFQIIYENWEKYQ